MAIELSGPVRAPGGLLELFQRRVALESLRESGGNGIGG